MFNGFSEAGGCHGRFGLIVGRDYHLIQLLLGGSLVNNK